MKFNIEFSGLISAREFMDAKKAVWNADLLTSAEARLIINFGAGNTTIPLPAKFSSSTPAEMLACVVRQFGSPAPTETTFYHGLRYGHAIERAAASPVFAGGRETAQYNARLLNNCICDDQLVESRYVRLLPITKIIVPEGTMLLDPNTFRPPCTDEDVRIFDGGLSATGNREKFTDNVFMYELTEYRLMVKP